MSDQDPVFVKQAFTSIAPRYVLANHVLSLGIDVLWRKQVARMVAEISPARVLDVATGSGDLAVEIQKACPAETEIVGLDFCEPMLDHARKRGLKNLVVGDATALEFENASFDAVTVAYGLRNMESWSTALSEFRRVLRPDGRLVVLDFSLPQLAILREPYRFYLHHILPPIGGLLTGNQEAYAYLGDSIERFPSGQAMCELIRTANFTEVESIPVWGGISSIYSGRVAN